MLRSPRTTLGPDRPRCPSTTRSRPSGRRAWVGGGADPCCRPVAPVDEAPAESELFFGSVDEFVREKPRFVYVRRVGPPGPHRWAAEWWKYSPQRAVASRRCGAGKALRLEPTFGMSVWVRDHADHQAACSSS
ncbi:DUF4913 domain-containing protein [Pseudolysinimonas sp.]